MREIGAGRITLNTRMWGWSSCPSRARALNLKEGPLHRQLPKLTLYNNATNQVSSKSRRNTR